MFWQNSNIELNQIEHRTPLFWLYVYMKSKTDQIPKKYFLSGKQMPFYFALTTFRVLSISLIIVSLPYTFIFLYALAILGIIILGFLMVSNEEGFLARGLRSVVTTGETKQICWSNVNPHRRPFQLTNAIEKSESSRYIGYQPTQFSWLSGLLMQTWTPQLYSPLKLWRRT